MTSNRFAPVLTASLLDSERPLRCSSTSLWPLRLPDGELNRAHHAARLRARLLVLVVRLGVGDRAAAGLDVGGAVLADDGADADAGVEVARVAEVADRAAVRAALDRLELLDDLHRPDLRRAGQRPGGQRRAQRLDRADVGPQPPGDVGDDVDDVRVGLDAHEALYLDGPVLAHAPEVVAAEVDEHHVLGALLLVGEQLLADAAVLLERRAARARAGDRARGHAVAHHGDERLRRRADDLEVLEVQVVHVRRRVDRSQAAVDRERLETDVRAPALRRDDLEGV